LESFCCCFLVGFLEKKLLEKNIYIFKNNSNRIRFGVLMATSSKIFVIFGEIFVLFYFLSKGIFRKKCTGNYFFEKFQQNAIWNVYS